MERFDFKPYKLPQTEEKNNYLIFAQGHLELNGRVKMSTTVFSPESVVFGIPSVLGLGMISDFPYL